MSSKKLVNKQSKIYQLYESNKYVLLSSLVAFLICQLIAYCYNLLPYGDMTILRMDLYHQYGPLFAELYDRLTSGESLIYSWNSGLGSTFLGNFFNYLSSPLTLIILLFGHKNITEAISCLIMLKAVFSAGTFTYYVKKSLNQHSAFTAGFGVLYAFSGYFVAYYWNLMWLDAMVLFPLVMLGIENIINKGKPALYCISLALVMFSNYYMAYMVCLFSVIYFITYYFSKYPLNQVFDSENNSKSIISKLKNSLFVSSGFKFAAFSIVAALLSAISLLPLVSVLSESSATSGTMPAEASKYFTAFDFLANHLASTQATIRSSGGDVLPNVYCGILTVFLVPLYLFSKKITIREKVANVILLGIIYFSFNINYLNYIWHGFHFPNDLPYRFSFMYSFIILTLAIKALVNIREYSGRQLLATGIGLVAFIMIVEKITSKNVNDTSLLFSLVFAIGYVIILYLFKDKRFQASAVSVLLLCTISSEIALGNTNNYSMNQSKTNYVVDYDEFKQLKAKLDEYNGETLYRMELTELRTRMDPCWFDYNGVSIFSSMAFESVANLQQQVGLYGNFINSYTYSLQTPIYNAMFGLKYIVNNDSQIKMNQNLMTELFGTEKFTAYENKYPLSVAFAADNAISRWNGKIYDNPFLAQSEFFRYATGGVDGVFTRIPTDNVSYENIATFNNNELENGNFEIKKISDNRAASVCFEFTPKTTENVYIYINSKAIETVIVSGEDFSRNVPALDEPHIFDLGLLEEGKTVFVDIDFKTENNTGDLDFYAYSLNLDKFEEGYNKLQKGNFEIKQSSDTLLVGEITADSNKTVFTSIPYDSNWRVYVDGNRLSRDDLFKISDALLAFDIEEGTHSVVFQYYSSGLVVGEFVSVVTILIATIIIILKRKKLLFFKAKKQSKWETLNNTQESNDNIVLNSETSEIIFDDVEFEEEINQAIDEDTKPTIDKE